jgi:hypothetical protein
MTKDGTAHRQRPTHCWLSANLSAIKDLEEKMNFEYLIDGTNAKGYQIA